MSDAYWRQLRSEYMEGRLVTADEEAAYEASRNDGLGLEPGWVSDEEMEARWAAERAAAMAAYDPRDFGWWNSDREAS